MWLRHICTILFLMCVSDTSCGWWGRPKTVKKVTKTIIPTTTTTLATTRMAELQTKLTLISSRNPSMERDDNFVKSTITIDDNTPGSTNEDRFDKGIMQTTSAITNMAMPHELSTVSSTNPDIERNDTNDDRYDKGIMQTTAAITDMTVSHELTTVSSTNPTMERTENILDPNITINGNRSESKNDGCGKCIMQTDEKNLPMTNSHMNVSHSQGSGGKSIDGSTVTLIIWSMTLTMALIILLLCILKSKGMCKYTKKQLQSLHLLTQQNRRRVSVHSLMSTVTGGLHYENIIFTDQATSNTSRW